MKSLRGYMANYSPISYEDVDIAHLNYEEENTSKNYLDQIRCLLEEGNAGGYVSAFDRGFSGGLGRKVGGFINAVGSYPVDRAAEWLGYENVPSFSDRYNEIVQRADASEQQLREEHPYAALGTEMLGNALGLGNAAYGIAGRFGLNGVTRMGSAGAIDAAVNTFGGADNLSDAVTTLPQNTATGFAGGAIMGKLGDIGSRYGSRLMDWGQSKLAANLNNQMRSEFTQAAGHQLDIPQAVANRQQAYDNYITQNAGKEVVDYAPITTRYPGDNVAVAKSIRRNMSRNDPNFKFRIDENGNYDYDHFVSDSQRAAYLQTFNSTYKNPQYEIMAPNKEGYIMDYLLSQYYNPNIKKNVYDKIVKDPVNGVTVTKFAREGNNGLKEFEKVFKKGQSPQASEAGLGLSQAGNAPSSTLRASNNITLNTRNVNRNLPDMSVLYNELTPTQVDLMNNALRQGLGQSAHKAGTLDSMDKIRQAANLQNGSPADLTAIRGNINNVMKPHTGQLDDKLAQVKRMEQYYQQGYNNQPVARTASDQQFHNNVEKQAYLQGQLQRLSQGSNIARDVLDNQGVLRPLMTDKRYNRLYSKAQYFDDAYRNLLELRAKYAQYLRDMYSKTAPHAVNDIT